MRVSDYIISFLNTEYNVDTFFTVSGGGCIFLIDSLGNNKNIKYIPTHHEQTAALAAEGYARLYNKLGACVITSGPGGTNALTGTLCSYQDSVPVIFISGQVNTHMTTNFTGLNLRQLGDQEFNIVQTVKNMTKYAYQVNDPLTIKYHLEKASWLAVNGRPGPVWIDLPLNVQSANIDINTIDGFFGSPEHLELSKIISIENDIMQLLVNKINESKKPLLLIGNGIRLSGGIDKLKELLHLSNLPVISAVNGNDIINDDYEYYFGRFGTHAQICANKLIQESDLIISIGTRLYVRQIGYNFSDFGRKAYKVHVDIDKEELNKPTLNTDLKIHSDASNFLNSLLTFNLKKTNKNWLEYCNIVKDSNPTVLNRHRQAKELSIYNFIEKLNNYIPLNYDIITSDGSANIVSMQVLKLKGKQRLITNTGCAPMGYGLPAAIGASINGNNILCLEGDGSIQMNIQDLQTIKHYNLPIKLIIINNGGYTSIKITQKSFFNGNYIASEKNSGISFPNYKKVISAYGIQYMSIKNNKDINNKLSDFFKSNNPIVLEVFVDPEEFHEPKVTTKMDDKGNFIPGSLDNINWIT